MEQFPGGVSQPEERSSVSRNEKPSIIADFELRQLGGGRREDQQERARQYYWSEQVVQGASSRAELCARLAHTLLLFGIAALASCVLA